MAAAEGIALLVAAALVVYLLVALLFPERLG